MANLPQQLTVPALVYAASTSASVGTSSASLVSAGAYTRSLTISTLPASTTNVWLRPDGGAAAVGIGYMVAGGGGSVTFGGPALPMPTTAITAITDGPGVQVVALAGG